MTAMYAPCLLLLMLVGTSGHFFRSPFMRRGMFPFRRPFFPGFRPGFHPGFHPGFNLGFHPGFRMGIPTFPIAPAFARGSASLMRPGNTLGFSGGRRSALARSLAETLIQGALSPSSIALSEAIGGNANALSNVGGTNMASTGWDQAQAAAIGNIANSISTANRNGITVVNPFGSDGATQDLATQALIANEVFDARPNPQTGMNTASKLSIQENVPKPIVTVTGYTADTGAGYTGSGASGPGYTADTGAGYTGSGAPGPGYTADTGAGYIGSGASGPGYTADTGAAYTGSRASGPGYTADTGAGYTGSGASGPGYTADTGAGYTGSGASGPGYTADTGAAYTGSGASGPGYTADTGAGYTGSGASGPGYTADTGAGYIGSGAPVPGYTADTGAAYTGSGASGPGYTADTGAAYTGSGSSGPGYTADTGAGYIGSGASGPGYTADTGAGYIGSGAPVPGYTADTGAAYTGSGASGPGYTADTRAAYTGSGASGPGYTADTGAAYTGSGASGPGYTADTGAGYIGSGASGPGYTADTGAGYIGSGASGPGYTADTGAAYTGSGASGPGYTADTGAAYTGSGASGPGYTADTGAAYTGSGASGPGYTADTGAGYIRSGASGAEYTGSGKSGAAYTTDVGANGGNTGLYDQAAAINSVLYLDAPSSPSSGAAVKADQGSQSNQLTGAAPSNYREVQQGPPTYLEMTGTTGPSGAAEMRTIANTIDQQYNQGVSQSSQGGQVTYETTVPQDNTQYGQVNMAALPVSTGNYLGDLTAKTTGSQTYDVQAAGNAGGAQGGIISLNEVMGGQQQAPPQGAPQGAVISRIEAQSGIGNLGGPMYETGRQAAGDMGQLQNGYDLGVGNIPMSSAMQGGEQASLGMMSQGGEPLFDGSQGGPMYETRGSGGAYSPDMLPSLHSENQQLMAYNRMGLNQGFEQMSALPRTTVSEQSGPTGTNILTVTKGLPMAGDFPKNTVTGESMNTPGYMKTRSMTVTI